jgi:chromosomal replication initiator protein
MENTYGNKQPFTEQLPSANRVPMKPQEVDAPFKNLNPELKKSFCNSRNSFKD